MISTSTTGRNQPRPDDRGRGSANRGRLRLMANIAAGHSTALPGESALQHALRLQNAMRPAAELPLVSLGQGQTPRNMFAAPAAAFIEATNEGSPTSPSSTGE